MHQAQRARDLPRFEEAVEALRCEKDDEIRQLKAHVSELEQTLERERSCFDTADAAAR